MFKNIKDQINTPIVREIMAESAFDNSPRAMDYKAAEFLRKSTWQLYGYVENGEILGVCGFEVRPDWVEILNIAVLKAARGRKIASAMITALKDEYQRPIEAETGDGAVGFYRKYGFEITETRKYDVARFMCVLGE